MLVLSRSKDEDIVIRVENHIVTIKVTDLTPGTVKLGFTATPNVGIYRKEVDELKYGKGVTGS